MQVFDMFLYTAIVLGVLVFIHELGHFLAAKLTGMRVDRFSIGFPPRAFGRKVGETDYCISWIPLGGYVKIAGMVDESMDTEFAERAPQPWEFRSKPMRSRMFVICAGVIMNVLLAAAIFTTIHYVRGGFVHETTRVGWVVGGSASDKGGVLAGDSIVAVNGKRVTHWDELETVLYVENLGNDVTLQVVRNGRDTSLFIPARLAGKATEGRTDLYPAYAVVSVQEVVASSPASRLGLAKGDTLMTVDGKTVGAGISEQIRAHAGLPMTLAWKRGTATMSGTVDVPKEGRIGIQILPEYAGPKREIHYSPAGAFTEGLRDIGQSVGLFTLTVSKIFAGKTTVKESFGGPIAIAQLATRSAENGFIVFIWFMAQLSMSLAILNILPIPALDGGHLIMLVYEAIFRREIPHRVKLAIQQAGFILLLAFMAFVIYNDISKF